MERGCLGLFFPRIFKPNQIHILVKIRKLPTESFADIPVPPLQTIISQLPPPPPPPPPFLKNVCIRFWLL